MTEVKIEYFSSVTQTVNGLASAKKSLYEDLKELTEHYEKQEKHLKHFKKNMSKLEESSQSLYHSIEQKKKIEAVKQDKYLLEIEGSSVKVTELTDLSKQYLSQYKKNTYKLNNSIFTLEQKKKNMDERLSSLYVDKDELTDQLNALLTQVSQEKQGARDQLNEIQSRIQQYQTSIREQEEEDNFENQNVKQLGNMSQENQNQAKNVMSQMNEVTKRNLQNLQTAISQIEENISIVQSNITILNQAIQDQKKSNQTLQIQLTEIQEKINMEIDIVIEQREQLTKQVKNFELDSVQQLDQFTLSFNQVNNELSQYRANLEKHKATRKFLGEQDQELQSQVLVFQQQQQTQRYQLQSKLQELNERENTLILQFNQEKEQLKSASDKYISRHQELCSNYESHCYEMSTIKQSYEQTITNINIQINESKTVIHNYEQTIQTHQQTAEEYRPPYFVVQKNKGKFIPKVVEGEEEEDDMDDDDSASESDEEHFNLIVNFLTKDKIKTSKKKVKIEVENGTYYLEYNGYLKKADKDKNIIHDTRKNASKNFHFSYRVRLFDEVDKNTGERLVVKENKIHKLKVSKKKGTAITLKVARIPQGAINAACGKNQHFYGTYESNGRTIPMALSGINIEEDGRIHGVGSDIENGEFTIEGNLDTIQNDVKFIKQYKSGSDPIEFNGIYSKKQIKGRWSMGLYSSTFVITNTQKVFNYQGWYEQDGTQEKMSFILMSLSGSEVEGEGMDDVGAFKWTGSIEKSGKFDLIKTYLAEDYGVNYKGLVKGKKITGIWDIGGQSGNFEVEEQLL